MSLQHGKETFRGWNIFQICRCHRHQSAVAVPWHSPFITNNWSVDPTPALPHAASSNQVNAMIRKLKSGEYRLYSRKTDAKTGKRKNLGTFSSRAAAVKHEREVQYFKRHG
jgi:hypothetical protein